MTSRERILTVLRGDLPDRVPVWQWGVHPWLTGVHPSIQPVVDAFLARGDTIHWWSPGAATFLTASDQLTVTGAQQPSELPDFDQHTATYHTPAGDLTEITYASRTGKPGYRKKYLLETEADVAKLLSVPYVPHRPDCAAFHAIDRELGDSGLPMVSLPADPMYYVNNLIGSETFAYWSVDKRALVDDLIHEFARRIRDWTSWVISQGVGPLFGYVGPELCIPPLQSPRDFEQWVIGPNSELHDLIHRAGGYVFVHCHGKVGYTPLSSAVDPPGRSPLPFEGRGAGGIGSRNEEPGPGGRKGILEGFVTMGTDALHPIEPPPMGDVTLPEAKARVGRDLTIVGNIQHHDLCTMPEDLFREMVAETMRVGKEGGRFILSPTATPFGWPTMDDRTRSNHLAMLEVGLQLGRY